MKTRWLVDAENQGFGPDNLPYGVFAPPGAAPRVGVRIGAWVLDLPPILREPEFARPSLNAFMARGSTAWRAARSKIGGRFATEAKWRELEPHLYSLSEVSLHPPFDVADLLSFRSPIGFPKVADAVSPPEGTDSLWDFPRGVHGRSGTVGMAGQWITRPDGLGSVGDSPNAARPPHLDVDACLGFVVGSASEMGRMVGTGDFAQHVFGVVLVSEWTTRDPLWGAAPPGPVRSPCFATSISPWVIPLDALGAARVPGRPQHSSLLPHLRRVADWGLDITMDVKVNGELVARPSVAGLYWTGDQMLAHLTSNGANVRTGDLYTSGPVTGAPDGQEPRDGGVRSERPEGSGLGRILQSGDEVVITAWARGLAGGSINLGDVGGTVDAK